MELHQLRAVVAVAREGSVSRAAQVLNRTQPAVTMAIKKLERELDVVVLEPAGRGVRLTAVGEVLVEGAEPVLEQLGELVRRVQGSGFQDVTRAVRVAADRDATAWLLPAAIRRLRRAHPERGLAIRTLEAPEGLAAVREGRADLAVLPLRAAPAGLGLAALVRCGRVAIAPREHPLPVDRPLTLADLASQPLVLPPTGSRLRHDLDRAFAEAGLEPEVAMEAEGAEAAAYVGLGFGVAVVSGYCARARDRRLRVMRVSDLLGDDCYAAVIRADAELSPAARRLVTALAALGDRQDRPAAAV